MDQTTAKQIENLLGQIYFNGFQVVVGAGDISITLTCDNVPLATLHSSYTVTKTLGNVLNSATAEIEKKGIAILDMRELSERMKASDESKSAKT